MEKMYEELQLYLFNIEDPDDICDGDWERFHDRLYLAHEFGEITESQFRRLEELYQQLSAQRK